MTLALLTFTNKETIKSVHFKIDNKTALSYLLKMVETEKISGVFFMFKGITITTEYLLSALNQKEDWQSSHTQDSSEWQLSPTIFSKIW